MISENLFNQAIEQGDDITPARYLAILKDCRIDVEERILTAKQEIADARRDVAAGRLSKAEATRRRQRLYDEMEMHRGMSLAYHNAIVLFEKYVRIEL